MLIKGETKLWKIEHKIIISYFQINLGYFLKINSIYKKTKLMQPDNNSKCAKW